MILICRKKYYQYATTAPPFFIGKSLGAARPVTVTP
jgi:hypothetical protein